jgi:single-strand DNA-binding protein
MNVICLKGRFTAKPELKKTKSGLSAVGFTMAVDRDYKSKDGQKLTDFINCIAYRGTAEFICGYFDKGDMIAIVGELNSRVREDRNGNKFTVHEVIVSKAEFCGSKKKEASTDNAPSDDSPKFTDLEDGDDLPF